MIHRDPPKCFKCGQPIKAVYEDQSDIPLVLRRIGDTFLYWDFNGHKCHSESTDLNPSVKNPDHWEDIKKRIQNCLFADESLDNLINELKQEYSIKTIDG